MPATISGATLSGGSQIYFPPPPLAPPTAIYDLDAANYAAVPTNGSTINGFTLTVSNSLSSIAYSSANGGYFYKINKFIYLNS